MSVYDERGQIVRQTNARGKTWFYSYDAAGRLTDQVDPNGIKRHISYTPTNLVSGVVFSDLATGTPQLAQSFVYDEAGILSSAIDGSVTSSYNKVGVGQSYQSDPYGLVHRMTETLSGQTSDIAYNYNQFQDLIKIQAVGYNDVNYSYDGFNRVSAVNGITKPNGVTYDFGGRLSGIAAQSGITTTFGYDVNSRLESQASKDKDGALLRADLVSYDFNNNVVFKQTTYSDTSNQNSDNIRSNYYGYDERDSLVSAQLNGRFAADMDKDQSIALAERDVAGQKALVHIENEFELGLDTNSRSIGIDFGQVVEVYGFIVTPRVASRIIARDLQVFLSTVNAPGNFTLYGKVKFTQNADGSILLRFYAPQWARYAKLHCTFDERNADNTPIDVATAKNNSKVLVKAYYFARYRNEAYSYDDKGRRTNETIEHPQNERDDSDKTYSYYPNSELLKSDQKYGYRYDATGNLIAKGTSWIDGDTDITIQPSGEAWQYSYDAINRLVEVSKLDGAQNYVVVASYTYNHKNERIRKVDGAGKETAWIYDGNGNVQAVLYPDGTKETLIWLAGKIFARVLTTADGISHTRYLTTDHLGSTVLETDEQGIIVSQNDTSSFGSETGSNGFEDLAMRYTGKDFDTDTGLYYYNARWYDPTIGRFITEDPAQDDVLWYAYVMNNPMTDTDPTGLAPPKRSERRDGMTPVEKLVEDRAGQPGAQPFFNSFYGSARLRDAGITNTSAKTPTAKAEIRAAENNLGIAEGKTGPAANSGGRGAQKTQTSPENIKPTEPKGKGKDEGAQAKAEEGSAPKPQAPADRQGAKDGPLVATDKPGKEWIYGPKNDPKINPDGSTNPNTWTTPNRFLKPETATNKLDPFKPIEGRRQVTIPEGTAVQRGITPGKEGPFNGKGGANETLIPGGLPPGSVGPWRTF